MPRPPVYPTAAIALNTFIAEHFAPQLKAAGFRKNGRVFSSRSGSLIRMLSFPGSQWSTSAELGFDIRLGVWSDKVAAFRPYAEFGWDIPVEPKSASWVPAERFWHWREDIDRIARLWRGALRIDRGEFRPQFVKLLQQGVFEHAVPFLLRIDSEAAMLKHIQGDVKDATTGLYLAGLYSIAAPSEFRAFARRVDMADADDETARGWRICLQRMGYRPTGK